ncbi:hypothetical protein [Wolbachia endosymbiont (group A) of Agelastica alni]|uniref:hypothetical protein n=1 Tax=Wolbachia endosymbiont (group A) of Agelastica alni TaxID=3066130 RepID=UPI003341EEA0
MSNRRVPTVSEGRLNEASSNSAVSYKKEDQQANAFIRRLEPTQPLTLRLPLSLHQKLREMAFKTEDKITHIILKAIKKHLEK